jgi:hypothetical protein
VVDDPYRERHPVLRADGLGHGPVTAPTPPQQQRGNDPPPPGNEFMAGKVPLTDLLNLKGKNGTDTVNGSASSMIAGVRLTTRTGTTSR